MSGIPLLEVSNLTKRFPTGGLLKRKYIHAVDDVSFILPGDEVTITTLAGESGSGKTTIANLILGFLKPTAGEIRYKGKNIHRMSKSEWTTYRREVQAIFQDPYAIYNPFYKIERMINVPLKEFKITSSKKEAHELMLESLKAVGIRPEDLLGRYPHQLSGGERQRFMLARLLCLKPKIVVADEPISMIDVSLKAMFLNTLLDFKKHHGMSCIHITHNLSNAYYLGGDVMILNGGRVLEMGDMESVVKNPTHPYTKMLTNSIPHTDPKNRWMDKLELKVTGIAKTSETDLGCIFYNRCPNATERCLKERPPLVNIDSKHKVACFSCT
jgi:peptide/nickel transport system ATP-binding protein